MAMLAGVFFADVLPQLFKKIQPGRIKLNSKKIRDSLHNFLKKKRIFSKVYFFPIHLTDFYKKNFPNSGKFLPNTEKLSNQLLTLPLYPNMTSEEKQYLIESISEFFEKR